MSTDGPNDPTPDPVPDAVPENLSDPIDAATTSSTVSDPVTPKRGRSGMKRVLAGVVAAIVAFFGINAIRNATDSTSKIKAGECVVRDGDNGIKASGCDASGALKVIKKLDGTTLTAGCSDPNVTTAYTQERGSKKFVLCLGTAK